MPTPPMRTSTLGLFALVIGSTAYAACDAGDDTVYPNPLAEEGKAGKGGSTSAGGSNAGKAGSTNGGAAGASKGGASGSAGAASAAGNNGGAAGNTAGAAGAAGGGAGGASAGVSGAAGSGSFGGSGTFGGSAGTGGAAGSSGGAGGSGSGGGGTGGLAGAAGASGKAGGAGSGGSFDPKLPYQQACAALLVTLEACGANADTIKGVKNGCSVSEECATEIYVDAAPSRIMSCLGATCSVPSVLPDASNTCMEQGATDASKNARASFRQKVNVAVDACQKNGDLKNAAAVAGLGELHSFYRIAVYNQLGKCFEGPCKDTVACVKSALAGLCGGIASPPGWIWPTDAAITNAPVP